MTHSIKSLGKAFPLDSLQRAAVSPVGSVGASKCLRPVEVATGDPHLCTFAPGKLSSRTAHPAFSAGHFDPLILLRVESGCPLGNLIFNDLEALQVESSAHFDHLIFTEWGVTCYRKTEVLKMITPVVLLRMKSSYHFDNLILIRLQSSSQSGNLIRRELQIKLRKA